MVFGLELASQITCICWSWAFDNVIGGKKEDRPAAPDKNAFYPTFGTVFFRIIGILWWLLCCDWLSSVFRYVELRVELFCAVLSCLLLILFLSCPVLSCPIFLCLVLCCAVLSCVIFLSRVFFGNLCVSCVVLSYLLVCCLVLCCVVAMCSCVVCIVVCIDVLFCVSC